MTSFGETREMMGRPAQVRNISVIAHVDHGKSTLTDSLLARGGRLSADAAGTARGLDTREDEQARGITIKSTGVTLHYELPEHVAALKPTDPAARALVGEGNGYLVNLIDSPGHVDFSSEVTAALRVTDGALVVVDCVEGVCVQTETVLRQALNERIRPVLVVNKMDRILLELHMDEEAAYQTFARTIESVNVILATFNDEALGEVQVSPLTNTVVFGSGLQGWGFTLQHFADMYAKKFNVSSASMLDKLWGDKFYDKERNQWRTVPVSEDGQRTLPRGFCLYVLKPIYQVFDAVMNNKPDLLEKVIGVLGIELRSAERELTGKKLLRCVMQKFLPMADALLELIVLKLPSPLVAQRYRVEKLYDGPMDDECATAIRECNPNGPVMMYVSKMVPAEDKGRFYAFGRVFSGTVVSGMKARILGPGHIEGKDTVITKGIQQVVVMMGRGVERMESVPCGNTAALVGLESALTKTGTITSSSVACAFRDMRFSVAPVVCVAVRPANPAEIAKLVAGLANMVKADPCVQCRIDESTGEHIVAATGELHLEICLNDLRKDHAGIEITVSEPVVACRETVLAQSSVVAMAKSTNKHNRLYAQAEPMSAAATAAIEDGEVYASQEFKARARILADKYDWDVTQARKIWAFGPEETGSNILVDQTFGLAYLNECKDSVVQSFQWTSQHGGLCEERMRGVRVNILDATLHADPPHRSGRAIIPMSRRCFTGAQLSAQPRLLEPMFLVDISCPETAIGGVYSTLNSRRGVVLSQEQNATNPLFTVKAHMPVMESFGFVGALRERTSGQAYPQLVFDHWAQLPGDPYDASTLAATTVRAIRVRKGLKVEVPQYEEYIDRL